MYNDSRLTKHLLFSVSVKKKEVPCYLDSIISYLLVAFSLIFFLLDSLICLVTLLQVLYIQLQLYLHRMYIPVWNFEVFIEESSYIHLLWEV